jgi:hypothetical protein
LWDGDVARVIDNRSPGLAFKDANAIDVAGAAGLLNYGVEEDPLRDGSVGR